MKKNGGGRPDSALLVTGGAGFIGSCFARRAVGRDDKVIVIDALTYAGGRDSLPKPGRHDNFQFIHGDIRDAEFPGQQLVGVVGGRAGGNNKGEALGIRL